MKILLPVIAHVLTTVITGFIFRKKEFRQDSKLYLALMLGGFIWSQLQTEYLIWRIQNDTKQTVKDSLI